MYGVALLFLTFCAGTDGAELAKDVIETKYRTFVIPVHVSPEGQKEIKTVRMFVSVDRGKTWKHFKDCKPSDTLLFTFTAPRDDLYWFAVQVVRRDGTVEPGAVTDRTPNLKIFFNSAQADVLDPEAAREALIRFVRANPKANEAPASAEDLRKAIISCEKDGIFNIHGIRVDPIKRAYSLVVVTGLRPGQAGGTIIQCAGSFRRDQKGTWAVVDARFSYTCVLAPPQPAGRGEVTPQSSGQ
jgi:hypothetical protein